MKIKQVLTLIIYLTSFSSLLKGMDQESLQELQIALNNKNLDLIKKILESNKHININAIEIGKIDKYQILMYALYHDATPSMIEYLIKRGADVNIHKQKTFKKNICTENPLSIAIFKGNLEVMDVLLKSGVDIESQDPSGNTALIFAASCNKQKAVQKLLNAGANISTRNFHGRNAMDLAKENGHHEMVKILQERQRILTEQAIASSSTLFPGFAEIVSEYVVCPKEPKKS